jgi:GNAT superfamily N-acetyltransferase
MSYTVEEFIILHRKNPFLRSLWIDGQNYKVYLRVGAEYFDKRSGARRPAIAISHIIVEESQQRKGVFKNLLAQIEQSAVDHCFDMVLVEQVGNPDLRNYLLSVGYEQFGPAPEYPSDVILVKDIAQK